MRVEHFMAMSLTARSAETIPAVQGDSVRTVRVHVSVGGAPWAAPEDVSGRVQYTLPDGTPGQYTRTKDGAEAVTVAGNTVTWAIDGVLTGQAGAANVAVVLTAADGGQVGLFPFRVLVTAQPGIGSPESVPSMGKGFEGKLLYGGKGGVLKPLAIGTGLHIEDDTLHAGGGSGGSSGPAYVASEEPPEDTSVLWIDTDDDSGTDLKTVVDTAVKDALSEAKASGEFDGEPGPEGPQGPQGPEGPEGPQGPQGVPGTDGVIALTGASVGQIAKITAVDENGVPTAWEPVDMPSGGGGEWEQLSSITLTEDAQVVSLFDGSLSPYVELLVEVFPTSSTDEDKKLTSNVGLHIANHAGKELAEGGSYWASAVRYNICSIKLAPRAFSMFANGNATSANLSVYIKNDTVFEDSYGLKIYTGGFKYFGIGSKFNVWGLKK